MKNLLIRVGKNSKKAFLGGLETKKKDKVLINYHQLIKKNKKKILNENKKDVRIAYKKHLKNNLIERLILDDKKILNIINSIKKIIKLKDPTNLLLDKWKRPNGLSISKVSIPIGVIGVIYESRPNVTADAGALCLKSGNASILRGGSDSIHSCIAIHNSMIKGLNEANITEHAIQIIEDTNREAVNMMLQGINKSIDVIVPRGGKNLVAQIEKEAKVPVFAHLEGICHIYIDKDADSEKAINVCVNAKMRRPGICGAVETILVHTEIAKICLSDLINALSARACEIRGCKKTQEYSENVIAASDEDWTTEYLLPIVSIKIVKDVEEAIEHIDSFSSGHTESILTENLNTAAQFQKNLDSAIVMHNVSTQFADGGEFGLGGEIGIATGKFHARGPVGVDQLTSFKYLVNGNGHTRP